MTDEPTIRTTRYKDKVRNLLDSYTAHISGRAVVRTEYMDQPRLAAEIERVTNSDLTAQLAESMIEFVTKSTTKNPKTGDVVFETSTRLMLDQQGFFNLLVKELESAYQHGLAVGEAKNRASN